MPTISDKIKRALASIEQVRKDLTALDEANDEIAALSRTLSSRRNEVSEAEHQLVNLKAQIAAADQEHSRWQQVSAKARQQGNAEIDRLNQERQELEKEVSERRSESDSILAGIRALGQRLKV